MFPITLLTIISLSGARRRRRRDAADNPGDADRYRQAADGHIIGESPRLGKWSRPVAPTETRDAIHLRG